MRLSAIVVGGLLAGFTVPATAAQDGATGRAFRAGAYAEAEVLARASLAEVEAASASDSLKVARALDVVVTAAIGNGKAADGAALALARRALDLKERQLGPDAADLALSLHNLAGIHDRRGEFGTALPLDERGLAIRRATARPDSPEVADSLDALARTFLGLERRPEAERAIEEALPIRSAHAAESPLALARTLELSGRAKRDGGRYQQAAADLDRALELWGRFAATHPDRASALDVRGYVYFLQGDMPASRRVWAEASDLTDGRLDVWHPDRARSARSLAIAEFVLGRLARARASASRPCLSGSARCRRAIPKWPFN